MKVNFKLGSLNIVDNPISLNSKIKKAISEKFAYEDTIFEKRLKTLNEEVADFFYNKFLESDTYRSLVSGTLRGEFGFSDSYLENIDLICRELTTVFLLTDFDNSKKFIKITIGVADNDDYDFNDLGVFTTEKGAQIHWLYWLLIQGNNIVVPDYRVAFKSGAGRSHMAIMIKDDYIEYSVDSNYGGIKGNNWITRTIEENKEEFVKIIKRHLNGA